MMRLGIKTGLRNWKDVPWDHIPIDACEIHFRMDRISEYKPLFRRLKYLANLDIGLHFWGVLENDIVPTFAVKEKLIRLAALQAIKDCIDVAASEDCVYVVVHTPPRKICKLSLETGLLEVSDIETPIWESQQYFLEGALLLNEYATRNKVKFVIETETKRKPQFSFRESEYGNILDSADLPLEVVRIAGAHGIAVCADVAHIVTWFADMQLDRHDLLDRVLEYLISLKPYISVVHIASTQPPFTIDTTNGLTEEEIAGGVFPNRAETIRLLQTISETDAVIIPEPRMADHLYHNSLLTSMLENLYNPVANY